MMRYSTVLLLMAFNVSSVSLFASPRSGYFKIDSLELETPDSDIGPPLDRVVGEATVVGLGEAIHTSGGLHKSMARSAKYLISKKGFRAIAIETPWKGVELVNRYVNSCQKGEEGSVKEALNGVFPQFRSDELAELFRFVCRHNADHPHDRVTAFGFDMQQWGFEGQPHAYDAQAIVTFLEKVDSSSAEQFNKGLLACGGDRGAGSVPGPSTTDEFRLCQDTVSKLVGLFAKNKQRFIALTSQRTVDLALISLEVQKFWPRYAYLIAQASQHPQESSEADQLLRQAMTTRDHGMAQVFVKASKAFAAGAKTILLAHTGHLAHRGEEFINFVDKTMGSWLDDYYGSCYRVIGAIARQLEVADWWEGEEVYTAGDEETSRWLEVALARRGDLYSFLDTKQNPVLTPGKTYILSNGGEGVPAEHFDGLFFMIHSPAMTPLR